MTDFVCVACGVIQERAIIRCEKCGKPFVFADFNERYILDGREPVPAPDLMEWGRWMETADRTVKWTEQGDVHVSTVFLGLDHQFGEGPPLLFETMAFIAGDGVDQRRYSTWREAEQGHDEIVRRIFVAAKIDT
jgi:predicted ATP-dependent serine protease